MIGMLPLRELALDSHAYRQQPSMPRPQFSHLDNEGVKGLVDSICSRMRSGKQCVCQLCQCSVIWSLGCGTVVACAATGCVRLGCGTAMLECEGAGGQHLQPYAQQ
jgi:hypothetical protein